MTGAQEETIIRVDPSLAHHCVARIELDSGVSFAVHESCLPMIIGRERSCDVCIPSGHVSRKHCELYLINGVLCLKDTSTNGTNVGQRLVKQESCSIQGPTVILLAGETRITVVPFELPEVRPVERSERRHRDRRMEERRHHNVVVQIERRQEAERRICCRRA